MAITKTYNISSGLKTEIMQKIIDIVNEEFKERNNLGGNWEAYEVEEYLEEIRTSLISKIQAINVIQCCMGEAEQLKTEREPLSYFEWKKQLNMQKIEDTIFKISNEYKTINDLLDMYEDYYHSF